MKYAPLFISLLTFILVVSYIIHNEASQKEDNIIEELPAPGYEMPIGFTEYRNAISLELPDTLYFAGERVPLEIADVRERLDRELHINTYWHSSTIFLLKRGNQWLPRIENILKENNIPDDFKYIAAIEGGFKNDVSPKNAVGFWQILKSAGKENGLEINKDVDERYDP